MYGTSKNGHLVCKVKFWQKANFWVWRWNLIAPITVVSETGLKIDKWTLVKPINLPQKRKCNSRFQPSHFQQVLLYKAATGVMVWKIDREAKKLQIKWSKYANPTQKCPRKTLEQSVCLYLVPFLHATRFSINIGRPNMNTQNRTYLVVKPDLNTEPSTWSWHESETWVWWMGMNPIALSFNYPLSWCYSSCTEIVAISTYFTHLLLRVQCPHSGESEYSSYAVIVILQCPKNYVCRFDYLQAVKS